jgi:hypothetical protein
MELSRDEPLAFGLTQEQLPHVQFFVRYASPKTGAGRQEIHLRGTGEVTLLRTRAYDKPEELVEGRAPLAAVARLLDVTETEGFFALEDEYPRERHGGRYTLRITLPDREKQVVVAVQLPEHHPPQAFSHVLGALKLVAALGTRDAAHHRFLSTL